MPSYRMLCCLMVLFGMAAAAGPATAGTLRDIAASQPPLPLIINNPGSLDASALLGRLKGIVAASIKVTGRFTWDVGRGEVINPVGDLVASVGGGDLDAQLARVQAVITKWTLVRTVERDSGHGGLDLRVEPDDEVHHAGQAVTLVVEGMRLPYFTLLALAADGAVTLLYPVTNARHRDSAMITPDKPYRLPLLITPPFGADHFLVIASASALTSLHQAVPQHPEAALSALLDQSLEGKDYQIGIHGVFSAP